MNPKCPLDGGNTVRFASMGLLKCSTCGREYSTKTNLDLYRVFLDGLDEIIVRAVDCGIDPAELLVDFTTNHLMSSGEKDPAHVNGIEFGKLFEQAMAKRGQ